MLAFGDSLASSGHWADGSEYAVPGGDIKGYWEASRFDGLLMLALGWLASGDRRFADALNTWLEDWCAHNTANTGVNWRCAQETALRLLQTLLVADLLARHGGGEPTKALHVFVEQHARRIEPTLFYAVAQDNNHATSEAAALYVAGGWLRRHGLSGRQSARWQRRGRQWLENRIRRLVMPDGSFSQHSVNYHRLLLDTVSMVEVWRRRFGDRPFSDRWYRRARAARAWLQAMTDPVSGDAPNLGANDGARLFQLHGLPYRDFRPTVQVASIIFEEVRVYPSGPWDEPLAWLGIDIPPATERAVAAVESQVFNDGGYVKLADGDTWALLRLPHYRFRPAHADALHLDLWRGGRNLLRDGGSFSYNTDPAWMSYFPGTASHNTVQFDGRDQMPRLARFLFGSWLTCREFSFDGPGRSATAAYSDHAGAYHRRTVTLRQTGCEILDTVRGFSRHAVLRWRLAPGEWSLDGHRLTGHAIAMHVDSDVKICRSELVQGWQSLHYAERTPIPVWEIEINQPGRLRTRVTGN